MTSKVRRSWAILCCAALVPAGALAAPGTPGAGPRPPEPPPKIETPPDNCKNGKRTSVSYYQEEYRSSDLAVRMGVLLKTRTTVANGESAQSTTLQGRVRIQAGERQPKVLRELSVEGEGDEAITRSLKRLGEWTLEQVKKLTPKGGPKRDWTPPGTKLRRIAFEPLAGKAPATPNELPPVQKILKELPAGSSYHSTVDTRTTPDGKLQRTTEATVESPWECAPVK